MQAMENEHYSTSTQRWRMQFVILSVGKDTTSPCDLLPQLAGIRTLKPIGWEGTDYNSLDRQADLAPQGRLEI